ADGPEPARNRADSAPPLVRRHTVSGPEPRRHPHVRRAQGRRLHSAAVRAEPGGTAGVAAAGGGRRQAVHQRERHAPAGRHVDLPRGPDSHVPAGGGRLARRAVRAEVGGRRPQRRDRVLYSADLDRGPGPDHGRLRQPVHVLASGRDAGCGADDLLRGAPDPEPARGHHARGEPLVPGRGQLPERRVLALVLPAPAADVHHVLHRRGGGGAEGALRPARGRERDRRRVHGRVLGDDVGPDPGLRVRLDGPHIGDHRHAVSRGLAAAIADPGPRELQLAVVRDKDGAHHLHLPVDPVEPPAPEDGPAHGPRVEDTRAGVPDLAVRHRGRDARVPFGVL
ncbi:MAG: NADH-ubiquinone oxidoreductase chain H, partial [uncultured Rubrobacteraceae bacterium]